MDGLLTAIAVLAVGMRTASMSNNVLNPIIVSTFHKAMPR